MPFLGLNWDWILALKLGIPALIACVGVISLIHQLLKRMSQVSVDATVVRQLTHRDGEGDLMTKSVFQFETEDGVHEMEDVMAFRPPAHKIGQSITVLYPIGHPEQATVRRDWVLVVLLGMIVIGTVIVVFVVQQEWKIMRAADPLLDQAARGMFLREEAPGPGDSDRVSRKLVAKSSRNTDRLLLPIWLRCVTTADSICDEHEVMQYSHTNGC
ncbi:DUF3592 domain-containing protein [Planctopirus hydrillae]|nr:DUF3592 domain-containing protein [Planctopirus hydrillae]